MASLHKVINAEETPELLRFVEAVRDSRETVVIRLHGEDIAMLSPIKRRRSTRDNTEADIEAFRSAAGGWKEVDTDKLLEDIYADRDFSDRPPVIL